MTASLGGDARVPRPGSLAWLPSRCACRPCWGPGPGRLCRPPGWEGLQRVPGAGGAPKGPADTLPFSSRGGECGRLDGAARGIRGGPDPPAALPAKPSAPAAAAASARAPAVPAGSGEEAGRRGNNVVGCFADCQPRSRILLSTPLGLTATGPARRGKSPLIWSWKERGKVILRCLRRWVIRPQSLARTAARFRLPPVGGGAGQRLGSSPNW